ncbi:MAG: hypothetical protein ACXWE6_12735 [Nitrososphaeraceae archaeon]
MINFKCLSQEKILFINGTTKISDIDNELKNKVDIVNQISFDYLSDSIIACLSNNNLNNIETVIFHEVVLNKIPDFLFSCKKMKSLYILNADFVFLPKEISELKLLEEIYISSINAIDVSNLKSSKNLKKLKFPYTKFSVFPYFISELEKVEYLEISIFNTKQNASEWLNLIKKINNLNSLSIIGLKFKIKFEDDTFKLNLRELNFIDCNFTGLSSILKINCFKNIKLLSITNSNLRKVPEEIINYELINEIDLSGNRLRKVPDYLLVNCNIKKYTSITTVLRKEV